MGAAPEPTISLGSGNDSHSGAVSFGNCLALREKVPSLALADRAKVRGVLAAEQERPVLRRLGLYRKTRLLENDASVHVRAYHARVTHFAGGNGEDIAVEDDKICRPARFQRAGFFLPVV
jgi:hypothetical protein